MIFELASAKDLVEADTTQVLIVVIILSMILTPFLLRHIAYITDSLLPIPKGENISLERISKDLSHHVILIGYGRLGKNIASLLEQDSLKYIVIEQNIKEVEEAQTKGKPVIFGNAAQKIY